jgi:hypothetical protein
MSEQWYYQFMDQEMGPVDMTTLRALASDGSIGPDDPVREAGETEWRPAGLVAGLLPETADANELMGMLELAPDSPGGRSSPRSRTEQCYCRVLGVEMGPMPFDQLALLAGAGRLREQDEVRLGPDAEWITAGSIVGLFATAPAEPAPAAASAASELDDFELATSPVAAPVIGTRRATAEEVDRVWSCRVLGQEVGPLTFEEVFGMVERGELSPTDELRHGPWAQWAPADSIVGLFPEDETSTSDVAEDSDEEPEEEPEEDDDGFRFEDFLEEKPKAERARSGRNRRSGKRRGGRRGDNEGVERKSKPTAPPRAREPKDEPPADRKAAHTPPRERPVAAAAPSPPPPPPRPYTLPTAPVPAARPVPVKAPRERRSVGNPFAGIGGALGGMFGSAGGGLSQHWKPLAIAVALGGVAYALYFGLPFGSSRGPEVFQETLAIWEEAQRLKESPGDWGGFRSRTLPRVEQLGTELKREASSKDRLLQLMLYCHRDCLPEILNGEPSASPRKWAEMGDYMKEAQNYVK